MRYFNRSMLFLPVEQIGAPDECNEFEREPAHQEQNYTDTRRCLHARLDG